MGDGGSADVRAARSKYFAVDAEADVTRIRLLGSNALAEPSAARSLQADLAWLGAHVPNKAKLLFDFGAVREVGSPVLAGLVELRRTVRDRQGMLKLVVGHESLLELFHVTKLDAHFDLYESEDSAMAAFKVFPDAAPS